MDAELVATQAVLSNQRTKILKLKKEKKGTE